MEWRANMAGKPVFYSFHYDNDVMRVQQIRNIGVLEGNPPVNANDWERVKRGGEESIKRWIDENMKNKQCVIVLIGSDTSTRPWVNYEIRKAWDEGKPIFGIYIHNLKCPINGTCRKGNNPFDTILLPNRRKLSDYIPCYDPLSYDAYGDISRNLENWVNMAPRRS